MPVTAKFFGVPMKNQYDGTSVIDANTDDMRTSLHTATYVPNQDTNDFFNDATNEVVGTGYTALGHDHASPTVTYDTASDQVRFDAEDAAWTSASFTARIAVYYKNTGTGSTSPMLIYIDFGGDETVASGTFTIQFDATGIGYIDLT